MCWCDACSEGDDVNAYPFGYVHVKIVIAVARRHQVSKVFVRGLLALAAVAQIDYLGIELLRAKHESETFPRFKNLLGGAQCRNLKGKEVSSTLELPGK